MTTLIKPVITEKSMILAGMGVFTFMVQASASKSEVKAVVEKLFNVKVVDVHTNKVHTAARTTGRRRISKVAAPRKFARVTLKKGQTIALFDLKEEN